MTSKVRESVLRYLLIGLTDEKELALIKVFISRMLEKTQMKSEEWSKLLIIVFLNLLRTFYRVYFITSIVGISIDKLILKISSEKLKLRLLNKRLPVYLSQRNNVARFSKFLALLLSAKPLIKLLYDKVAIYKGLQGKTCLTNLILTSLSIYPFFPERWGLHTVSWFFLFFAIEYGYKLFEQKQINKIRSVKDKMADNFDSTLNRLMLMFYKFLRQKSWLIFPIVFSHVWKEHIKSPKNVHGLLQNLFNFTNIHLNKAIKGGNFIEVLRRSYNQNVKININYKCLFSKSIPQTFIKTLILSTIIMILKNFQEFNFANEDKSLDFDNLIKRSLRGALKFTVFLTGIPLTANILTTITINMNMVYGDYSLRLIGFISGLVAFLYKGRRQDLDGDHYSKVVPTNRDAWIGMCREAVISSTSTLYCYALLNKPHILKSMVFYDKVAFIIGLTFLLIIYDYYQLKRKDDDDEYLFHDAKIIHSLCHLINRGNSYI